MLSSHHVTSKGEVGARAAETILFWIGQCGNVRYNFFFQTWPTYPGQPTLSGGRENDHVCPRRGERKGGSEFSKNWPHYLRTTP